MKQVMQRNEYNLNKNKQTMIAITLIGEKKKKSLNIESFNPTFSRYYYY